MAEAGVTTPQIVVLGGCAIDDRQRTVDTCLPRRTEVALARIVAWEAGATSVVRPSSAGTLRPRCEGSEQ